MKMFKIDKGKVYYPYNEFTRESDNLLSVGSFADYVDSLDVGLGYLYPFSSVSCVNLQRTLLPCKTAEIAEYIANQFSDLIFEANFGYTDAKLRE